MINTFKMIVLFTSLLVPASNEDHVVFVFHQRSRVLVVASLWRIFFFNC